MDHQGTKNRNQLMRVQELSHGWRLTRVRRSTTSSEGRRRGIQKQTRAPTRPERREQTPIGTSGPCDDIGARSRIVTRL